MLNRASIRPAAFRLRSLTGVLLLFLKLCTGIVIRKSGLGLLPTKFRSLSTEFWPLVDVQFLFYSISHK